MDKKIIMAIGYGFVFIAFLLVSTLVVISGRKSFLIRRKLQLGALMIFLSSAGTNCGGGVVTCYALPPDNISISENIFLVDQFDTAAGEIRISRSVSNTLTGSISKRTLSTFSYAIVDSTNTVILSGDIFALDGVYDQSTEQFNIIIAANSLVTGEYSIRFFSEKAGSVTNIDAWLVNYFLIVIP